MTTYEVSELKRYTSQRQEVLSCSCSISKHRGMTTSCIKMSCDQTLPSLSTAQSLSVSSLLYPTYRYLVFNISYISHTIFYMSHTVILSLSSLCMTFWRMCEISGISVVFSLSHFLSELIEPWLALCFCNFLVN